MKLANGIDVAIKAVLAEMIADGKRFPRSVVWHRTVAGVNPIRSEKVGPAALVMQVGDREVFVKWQEPPDGSYKPPIPCVATGDFP